MNEFVCSEKNRKRMLRLMDDLTYAEHSHKRVASSRAKLWEFVAKEFPQTSGHQCKFSMREGYIPTIVILDDNDGDNDDDKSDILNKLRSAIISSNMPRPGNN